MAKMVNDSYAKVRETILQYMPKEAEITRIEFEGPRLAIYVRNVNLLLEHSYIITDIVNLLHKRVVIRSDPSVRMGEVEAERTIRGLIPQEAEVINISFDPSVGEVLIEAKKPGLAIGKNGSILQEITKATCWRPRVLRAPPLPSKIIASTRHLMRSEGEERNRVLRDVGERIFRPKLKKSNSVRLIALGAFNEVGRSAILIKTEESSVLLDCGINPGSRDPMSAYPRLDADEFDLDSLDALIVSHAHLDHCAMVPFLFKYGYDGPVYCTEPTMALMALLQLDFLEVYKREGAYAPYNQRDVREALLHTVPLKYGVVTDVAPDIKLTFHNAGHILGSALVHLHIGEGLHNIIYSADFKFAKSMLLEPAVSTFPRAETLIMESTYGGSEDVMLERDSAEANLVNVVNETVERNGKVLIPTPAVGRAQEVMLILDKYMKSKQLKEVPIFIEGMISEATAIHTAYPEYLAKEVMEAILYRDENPFQSEYFTVVSHPSEREDIIEGGPAVILATSGMMEGGPVIEYFKKLAPDERNALVFVSYQVNGTLGSRLKAGARAISMAGPNGKMEVVKVNMKVESAEGFSGHADRNQLINYVKRMTPRPNRIILNHGERGKIEDLSQSIARMLRIRTIAPEVLDTVRLR